MLSTRRHVCRHMRLLTRDGRDRGCGVIVLRLAVVVRPAIVGVLGVVLVISLIFHPVIVTLIGPLRGMHQAIDGLLIILVISGENRAHRPGRWRAHLGLNVGRLVVEGSVLRAGAGRLIGGLLQLRSVVELS